MSKADVAARDVYLAGALPNLAAGRERTTDCVGYWHTFLLESKMQPRALLVVLDGWGHSPRRDHNAIALAQTPNWDRLWNERPHTLVRTSGAAVGLPPGQMGNSEVGHLMIGAGRVVLQDLSRIDQAIELGEFQESKAIQSVIGHVREKHGRLHIMGLLSPGGVHSHERHFRELILALRNQRIPFALHAFLDGRDTPPKSAAATIRSFEELCNSSSEGRIVSVSGRFFAMDRDRRWDRTEQAWRAVALGQSERTFQTASESLAFAYESGESDEFMSPSTVGDPCPITRRDSVVFMNFRADRARQLSRAILGLDASPIQAPLSARPRSFVPLMSYADDIDEGTDDTSVEVMFAPLELSNSLGEYWSGQGYPQLRIAESEKTAHVTYFFSGGREAPFPREERWLVPSPEVRTYDLAPEMNARGVAEAILRALEETGPRLVVSNFANGDMVGHTGKLDAAVKAVECLDFWLGKIERSVLDSGYHCLITADHGNVESMLDDAGGPHTAHTTGPVPLVYVGKRDNVSFADSGGLSDVAPTLLDIVGMDKPVEMTGSSMLVSNAR